MSDEQYVARLRAAIETNYLPTGSRDRCNWARVVDRRGLVITVWNGKATYGLCEPAGDSAENEIHILQTLWLASVSHARSNVKCLVNGKIMTVAEASRG